MVPNPPNVKWGIELLKVSSEDRGGSSFGYEAVERLKTELAMISQKVHLEDLRIMVNFVLEALKFIFFLKLYSHPFIKLSVDFHFPVHSCLNKNVITSK